MPWRAAPPAVSRGGGRPPLERTRPTVESKSGKAADALGHADGRAGLSSLFEPHARVEDHDASLASMAFAALMSSVSKPSVNQ
jgi:hypothetical protein